MKLNALYAGATNMERALAFYGGVFERPPVQAEARFSMFDLGDCYFGLFCAAYDGEDLVFGNNCVPNIEVADIEAAYARLAARAPRIDPTIRTVKHYRYFQFQDLDGNLVEIYSRGN